MLVTDTGAGPIFDPWVPCKEPSGYILHGGFKKSMAKLPLELLSLDKLSDAARERIDRCYEKLLGLCRWFHIGMNGVLFPTEPGDPRLNTSYLDDLVAGRSPLEQERAEQFAEKLGEMLQEYGMGYEGTLELLDAEHSPDDWRLVRVLYAGRAFWRWY